MLQDSRKALDFLRRDGSYQDVKTPDPIVILLDIKLPKANGLEVLQQIRSDPKLRDLPVVMLTSSREETDLSPCYDLGANAYVVKPLGLTDLINTVRRLGVFWGLLNQTPKRVA